MVKAGISSRRKKLEQIDPSMEAELSSIQESFNSSVVLWIDTGEKDTQGRKILKNFDTQQEQVFVDK